MYEAASEGSMGVAKLLLTHKADVNAKDIGGWTPLRMAAAEAHRDIAELLLANKADISAKSDAAGKTPLHVAAMGGHVDLVELLLDNKADINAKDKNGFTPLDWAVASSAWKVADLLYRHGGREHQ